MVKPSLVSVGMGIGVLLLGGSGIAIPTLWSHANQVETNRDELQIELREARKARVAAEDAQQAVEQHRDELEQEIVTGVKNLATAEESKRVLAAQLAKMQARERDVTAANGTLQLRDQEMAALRQQLEQTRSDNATLLARLETVKPTGDTSRLNNGVSASTDLVPVPGFAEASGKSQTTAKPAATEPIRFDDRGWKSVAPRVR
jgi:predicted RNase H-like nuclease (RuvC/YqgF family)